MPFREGLIEACAEWATASVRAAFLFPSAWVLERIVVRSRLALPITVAGLYALGGAGLLESVGYLPPDHRIIDVVEGLAGLFAFAVFPLGITWGWSRSVEDEDDKAEGGALMIRFAAAGRRFSEGIETCGYPKKRGVF